MRNSIFVFISVFFLLSCSKRESSRILISGKVKNIPAKKLYLTDAYDWQVFLDSTSYVHNEFKFNYKPPGTFEPFLASICYFDSSNRIRKLFFKNFILSTTEKIYGFDAFFLEKGMTTIIGDINIKPDLDIVTGKETELLYKNQFTSWGYVNENDSLKRSEKIKQIKKTITENNESFYLLNCILEHRLSYRKEEFGTIFKLFSDSVQKSQTGTFLNKYLNILNGVKLTLNNISLINQNDKREYVIDSSKKINVVIFWGSWCGPCRQEIPELKTLFQNFSQKDVRMVSIAINDRKDKWKDALEVENMKWAQLYADIDKSEELKISFNIPSVPLIIITDYSGKELSRKSGFSNNKTEIHILLDSLLSTQ